MPDEFPRLNRRPLTPAPSFILTERDQAIIETVHRYRMLERRQVETLLFAPASGIFTNTNRARERLRLLYQHRYLERVQRPVPAGSGSLGPVYRLGVNGARLLAQTNRIPVSQFHYWGRGDDKDRRQTRVQPMFLEHGLALADLRIAIEDSAKRNGCSVDVWLDDVELSHPNHRDSIVVGQTSGAPLERIPVAPDGYFVLATARGRGCFFVEVDRSTETVERTWRRKILAYKHYVLSGQFHRRYGIPWPHTPLRILTTTVSASRAQNLKSAAERFGPAEATQLFMFAPLARVIGGDVLTSVAWLRAGFLDTWQLL